jgi:hypothetical protein
VTSIKITLTPAWIKANARAAEHAAKGLRAECLDSRHYRVHSATDDKTYIVTVHSVSALDCECSCPAGHSSKTVCWHKSAAMARAIRHIREVEGQRDLVSERPAPAAPKLAPVSPAAFAARMAAA